MGLTITTDKKVLHRVSEPVDLRYIDTDYINKMKESLSTKQAFGLSAIQFGLPQRIFVYKLENNICTAINPSIVYKQGVHISEETCLSVPDFKKRIKRAEHIQFIAYDENGQLYQLTLHGIEAAAIQHEVDHLNGIIISDEREIR